MASIGGEAGLTYSNSMRLIGCSFAKFTSEAVGLVWKAKAPTIHTSTKTQVRP
ncbi:hypothetical protein HanHA300_Chr04g0143691 [Helianthus annuus]|nr:hypothetical protein HanHA300_Chr04g0143691 [Helianthus annuus]